MDGLCFSLIPGKDDEAMTAGEIRTTLENGTNDARQRAMKQLIVQVGNGEECSGALLMAVIRFVVPVSTDKILKKLVLLFFELLPKTNSVDGRLKQEMILVCNALRGDLQHPNEYVRGSTLRFLARIREHELLAPLVPSVRQCLEHKSAHVRKNAIFTLIHLFSNCHELVSDADAILLRLLEVECDDECQRASFLALSQINKEAARRWLLRVAEKDFFGLNPCLQRALLQFMRLDYAACTPVSLRSTYLRIMHESLTNSVNSVRWEAANAIIVVASNSSSSISSAVGALLSVADKDPAQTVKLTILNQIETISTLHKAACSEKISDFVQILQSCSDLLVKERCVSLILECCGAKNFSHVLGILKKELLKCSKEAFSVSSNYAVLLIDSLGRFLHQSDCSARVHDLFVDLLGEADLCESLVEAEKQIAVAERIISVLHGAASVISPSERIISAIFSAVRRLKAESALKEALWLISYLSGNSPDLALLSAEFLFELAGPLPMIEEEERYLSAQLESPKGVPMVGTSGSSKVLPDGSYAVETSIPNHTIASLAPSRRPHLREWLIEGRFGLVVVYASCLCKLLEYVPKSKIKAALAITSVLRFSATTHVSCKMDIESSDRLVSFVRLLLTKKEELQNFSLFVKSLPNRTAKRQQSARLRLPKSSDFTFRQLNAAIPDHVLLQTDPLQKNFNDAVSDSLEQESSHASSFSKIVQFTGYSDAIYAEAYVTSRQFDVVLDVLVVNQTAQSIGNLSFDFLTLGTVSLGSRPATINLLPHGYQSFTCTLRLKSTENALIFGTITYDKDGQSDGCVIPLNDLLIDVVDYVEPASCSLEQFNSFYVKFEWENKIVLKGEAGSLDAFLAFILKNTNFQCITPREKSMNETYLSACLYAKSVFDEDIVANLSLEFDRGSGLISGHIRMRSKETGIAYSLGERVSRLGYIVVPE